MKPIRDCSIAAILVLTASTTAQDMHYPKTPKGDVVEEIHGVKVADPYRWLEDADSDETKAWVEAENKVTFEYLNHIPEREAIKKRLTQIWNFERYGLPFKQGNRYFYARNSGLQN